MAGVQSVFPEAKWAQRRDQLLITFCVEDCQNASVKFEKSKIHFSGVTDKPRRTIYDTELELFKNINPEKSNWQQTSRNITVQACKGESGPFWPRLLLSTAKQHWLKTDFEKMKDEDDPSTEEGDTDEYEKSRQFFDDNADSLTPPGSTEDVSGTRAVKFYLPDVSNRQHLMSFFRRFPEHFDKLEQIMKPVAVIHPAQDRVIYEIPALNGEIDESLNSHCLDTMKAFFKDYTVQDVDVQDFALDMLLCKRTYAAICNNNHNLVTIVVGGLTKDVTDKVNKLKNVDELASPSPPCTVQTEEEDQCLSKCVKVPKDFHKFVVGKGGSVINKLKSKHKVTIVVPPVRTIAEEIVVNGPRANVEEAAKEILNLLKQHDRSSTTIPIENVDLLLGLFGEKGKFSKRIEDKFKNDFIILRVRATPSTQAKIIGKGGCNIWHLLRRYSMISEIIFPDRSSGGTDVHLTGDRNDVYKLCKDLCVKYSAEFMGESRNFLPKVGFRYAVKSSNGIKYVEVSEEAWSSSASEMGVKFQKLRFLSHFDAPIESISNMPRIQCHWEKLVEEMKEFGTVEKRNGIIVIMDVTQMSSAEEDALALSCKNRIEKFFSNYIFAKVVFHRDSPIDKTDTVEDNVSITWDDHTAYIFGTHSDVSQKVSQFETLKNSPQKVNFRWYYGNSQILEFVETSYHFGKLKTEMSSLGTISVAGKGILVEHKVIEAEKKHWIEKCKEKLEAFFAEYSSQVIPFHPSSTVERTDCAEPDVHCIWTGNKTSVAVCGLKSACHKKVAAFNEVKKRKKRVSHTIYDKKHLLSFIKETPLQLQGIEKALEGIGAPVFGEDRVTINGEILETSSTINWERDCENTVSLFLGKFSSRHVVVTPELTDWASRLGQNRQDVVTKCIEKDNRLEVYGLDYAVKMRIDEITRILKQFEMSNASGSSMQKQVSANVEKTEIVEVSLDLSPSKLKSLHARAERNKFFNVFFDFFPSKVTLKGAKADVSLVSEFANSLEVMEIDVHTYGAYKFLSENSLLMEVINVHYNCLVLVERHPNANNAEPLHLIEDEKEEKLSYGRLKVVVTEGDITEEDCDMIVNTTSKTFSLNGPLSKVIIAKAGKLVYQEAQSGYNRMRARGLSPDSLLTSGGKLKAKYIVHVALPGLLDCMGETIRSILEHAHTCSVKCICIPAIGTGRGGWSCENVVDGMHSAFAMYSKMFPLFVCNVKIVLYPAMTQSDKKYFYDVFGEAGTVDPQAVSQTQAISSGASPSLQSTSASSGDEKSNTLTAMSQAEGTESNDGRPSGGDAKIADYATILLSSTDKTKTEEAEKELKKIIDLHLTKLEIDDRAIARLTKDHIKNIKMLCKDKNIRIVLDCRKEKHHISIEGRSQHASEIRDTVRGILSTISTDLPDNWQVMRENQQTVRVEVHRTTKEFMDIVALMKSANEAGEVFRIIKIERVQNRRLYQQYQVRKQHMSKRTQSLILERQLFHGTHEDTVDKICTDGFDRGFAGKNATYYGRGVYFSSKSCYSSQYSVVSTRTRRKYMILAHVLTGDYSLGAEDAPAAPENPRTGEPYDSVVDHMAVPSIFVVFKDASAYPAYVITFTSSSNPFY